MLLELKGVSAAYGKITAIRDISMTVDKGQIVTIIASARKMRSRLAPQGL